MSTDPTPQSPSAPPAPPQAAPPAPDAPPQIPSTPEERQLAMLCHIGGAVIPGLGAAVPLIIWNSKKDSPFVEDQAKEALSFLINANMCFWAALLFWRILATIGIIGVIGLLFLMAIVVGTLVMGLMGGLAANQGQAFRYPINARYF